jgi:surfeit locus 1 family protein
MTTRRRIWPIAVSAALGIAVLCSLGVWQVIRLSEKEALLAAIAQRSAGPPITLGEALNRATAADLAYRHVSATGRFDPAHALFKLVSFKGNPGWEVITPFTSDDGIAVLVDQGAIADADRQAFAGQPAQAATLDGVVMRHGAARGLFDPDNDAEANAWYWWDVPAMLAAVPILPESKVAPFIVQALPGAAPSAPGPTPQAAKPEVALSNNHLQYAITWFALAAVLLLVAVLFIRNQRRADLL